MISLGLTVSLRSVESRKIAKVQTKRDVWRRERKQRRSDLIVILHLLQSHRQDLPQGPLKNRVLRRNTHNFSQTDGQVERAAGNSCILLSRGSGEEDKDGRRRDTVAKTREHDVKGFDEGERGVFPAEVEKEEACD